MSTQISSRKQLRVSGFWTNRCLLRDIYASATAIKIDDEVRRIIGQGYNTAKGVLAQDNGALVRIALALLEREVLDANEIKLLVEGKELPPLQPPPSKPDDGVQHVIKPELQPGRAKGGERPATA